MPMPLLREAREADQRDFGDLLFLSAPFLPVLFGRRIKRAVGRMFCLAENLFSYQHCIIAEYEGRTAGMFLGYDWQTKRAENARTGILLLRYLGFDFLSKIRWLLRFNSKIGQFGAGEFYLSNIAVYSTYQRRGLGKVLLTAA